MKRLSVVLALALSAFSVNTWAFDFSQADAAYAAREDNLGNIATARAIYQQALTGTQGDELIHAADQLGRLAYYEGDLLTDEGDHDRRIDIFQQCQDDIEAISPDKIGKEVPAYYYWKAACTALWGKSASKFSVLGRVGALKDAMQKGLALDPNYAGGGMHRVIAAVYIKSKIMSFLGLYDPAKALEHVNNAIRLGPEYYNAYLVKAEVMKELGESDAGLEFLTNKKRELERRVRNKTLPAGLEPESKAILKQMTKAMQSW